MMTDEMWCDMIMLEMLAMKGKTFSIVRLQVRKKLNIPVITYNRLLLLPHMVEFRRKHFKRRYKIGFIRTYLESISDEETKG